MADGDRVAFGPLYAGGKITDGVTVVANASTPTASTQFPTHTSGQILITNRTSVNAHVQIGKFGAVTDAALDTGLVVLPMAALLVSSIIEAGGASVILEGASTNGSSKVTFHLGAGV